MSAHTNRPAAGLREYFRIDLPRGSAQPRPGRFVIATLIAVVASILACGAIAAATTALVPSTAGYDHFGFVEYARLTVIGVVVASIAWPVVTLVSSRARRLYLWLAIVVTIASLAPDIWILRQGQAAPAVIALMVMHVALLVITYPTLVFVAPQRRAGSLVTEGDDPRRSRVGG